MACGMHRLRGDYKIRIEALEEHRLWTAIWCGTVSMLFGRYMASSENVRCNLKQIWRQLRRFRHVGGL